MLAPRRCLSREGLHDPRLLGGGCVCVGVQALCIHALAHSLQGPERDLPVKPSGHRPSTQDPACPRSRVIVKPW